MRFDALHLEFGTRISLLFQTEEYLCPTACNEQQSHGLETPAELNCQHASAPALLEYFPPPCEMVKWPGQTHC